MSETDNPGAEAQAAHPRHIDPERGRLEGIGSGQQLSGDDAEFPADLRTKTLPPDQALAGASPTYYDLPTIKEPVWIWSVPAYFYTGGAAGGAALLGAVAQLVDRDGLDGLIGRCRLVAVGGTALGTVFLIHDLGRPARFLNMLRVFRPSSAMSMGSWTLAAISTASAGAVVLPLLGARRMGDVAGLVAGALGPVLSTYTAVLISDTAVPVWQATRRTTPALFGASGLVAATSLLDLTDQGAREEEIVYRLGMVAKLADLVAGEAVGRAADEIERVGRPLHQGASGGLWKLAKGCTAASLAVSLLPVAPHRRRTRRLVAAALGTIGSVAVRFAVFHAGTASARDPRATFAQQRTGDRDVIPPA